MENNIKLNNIKEYSKEDTERIKEYLFKNQQDEEYFDKKTHSYWRYEKEDIYKELLSASTIASALIPYSDYTSTIISQGIENGTELHYVINSYLETGLEPKLDGPIKERFEAFKKFHQHQLDEGWEYVSEYSETPLFGDKYACMIDILYRRNNIIKIVDIKSSMNSQDDYKRTSIQMNVQESAETLKGAELEILVLPKDNYAYSLKPIKINHTYTEDLLELKIKKIRMWKKTNTLWKENK